MLKPEGVVSLVIPDKRYCFDCFRPITTTGEVLDAFGQGRNRPTPGSVFENFANCVTLDGEISWSAGVSGKFESPYSFEVARSFWGEATAGDYVDVHVSRFTPAGFRLIVQDLRSLGLLRLEVMREFETEGNEFFVTLGQGATRASAEERVALLRRVESELAEAMQLESSPAEPPTASGRSLAVSPHEESMILYKRRIMEKIRKTSRHAADGQSGRG